MKQLQPKNLIGEIIFVKPYEVETTDAGIIIPKNIESKDDASPWYEITRTGEDVSKYEVGDVVLVSPDIIKRSRVYDFGMEDDEGNKVREAQITESNIMGKADLKSKLEL